MEFQLPICSSATSSVLRSAAASGVGQVARRALLREHAQPLERECGFNTELAYCLGWFMVKALDPEDSRPRPLVIFPRNGNGLEALDCLGASYELMAFVDDTPEKWGRDTYGHLVMGREALRDWSHAEVLAVPGGPHSFAARRAVIEGLGIDQGRFAQVIHPTAVVSPRARIGRNVLIMAGVVITSNAVIEDHVCVLPNTVVHHDARVGAWSLIGSNVTLAGGVVMGENCYVGSGSSIMNGLQIGAGALIGLGSNVIRDVATGLTVAGNPARSLAARDAIR